MNHRTGFGVAAAVLAFASCVAPASGADPVPADTVGVDEVHYTFTGPDSVTVDWRGTHTEIRYGPTDAYGSTATATEPTPLPWSSAGPWREVVLGGLAPGQDYHYSIGGGPDQVLHTAPTGAFSFVALGDIGDSGSYPWVDAMMRQIAAETPSFVLALGDLTYANYNCAAAVDQHFVDVEAWSRRAAYMPVWGNHEYAGVSQHSQGCGVDDTFANYKGRFALPHPQGLASNASTMSSGPGCPLVDGVNPCQGEDWAWFDAGPVRFITGPEPFAGAVAEWRAAVGPIMADAQATDGIRWIVTATHRPAYSSTDRDLATYRTAMDTLGDTYDKYVLNLNGHVHANEVFTPQHGVFHVTAGAGGEGVDRLPAPASGSVLQLQHPGYARFSVSASSLLMDVVCGPDAAVTGIEPCTPGETVASFDIGLRAPIADWAATCGSASCQLDAAAASDRDGPIASYAWDFGDGTSGTGVAPAHAYPAPGVYLARLTVTDSDGATDTLRQAVTVGDPDAVAFGASAASTARARVHRLTVPSEVRAGDGLLALLTTGAPARTLAVPSGWQLVDTVATSSVETFVLERAATAGSAGSVLRLPLSGSAMATTTLLAYRGTQPAGPVGDVASSSDTRRTQRRSTPILRLASPGAAMVSYWADRSQTTGWTLPAGVVQRAASFGTGSPHTSAVAADSGGPVPAGPAGDLTATATGGGGHATTVSVLLAPGQ